MKKLPKATIVRRPAHEIKALALWLNEWRIEKLLQDEDPKPEQGIKEFRLLYSAEPARAGQIRLLHPFSSETSAGPRYVAVLREAGDGTWLVAPFGRFAAPAVPGEWKTGRKAPALRVLCIWNARELPSSVLARSWVVDRLAPNGIAQALSILSLISTGEELPPALSRRTGPPVLHPLDPRHDYMEEERDWFSALSTRAAQSEPLKYPDDAQDRGIRPLPLAAEKGEEYRISKRRPGKPRPDGHNPGKDK